MSNENISDAAFFSWLDERIREARSRVNSTAADAPVSEYAYAVARHAALCEVRAYFGGTS